MTKNFFNFQIFLNFFLNSLNNYPPATEDTFTRTEIIPNWLCEHICLKFLSISNISLRIIMSTIMTISEPASSVRAGSTPGYILLIRSTLLIPLDCKLLERGNRISMSFLYFFFLICYHYFFTLTSI